MLLTLPFTPYYDLHVMLTFLFLPLHAGISLLWVAILGLVVLYIYSVVSFAFLHESLLSPDAEASLFCETLFQCLITMIRYGLMDSPGLVCT